ncbi:MAG: class I SAM-dependent methyltransferase [Dongiaceae bacterium]
MSPENDIAIAAMRGGEYDDGALYDAEYGGIDDDGQFFLELAKGCGPRILDLGCGTGRLAIPLCRSGKKVTGLDAMPTMIDHARRKAKGLPIRWIDGDFRDFDLGETYDLAISCAHAFQGLLTEDDQ